MIIRTIDQWMAIRDTMQPHIESSLHGDIVVPCVNTIICSKDLIIANTYNPNGMPDQKVEDLIESIKLAGFAYPVACWWDEDLEKFVIIDGFHRWMVAYEKMGMQHVPIVPLHLTAEERMMATWTFNKARGFHQVDLDAELIRKLIEQGIEEEEIATKLGIDTDTVYRYKQVTGIVDLFKNAEYSLSWNMEEA